jgi:hypothetical protein
LFATSNLQPPTSNRIIMCAVQNTTGSATKVLSIATEIQQAQVEVQLLKEGMIHCIQCNNSAVQESVVDLHVRYAHEQIKDHKCDECNFSSLETSELTNHLWYVHEKGFKCSQCHYLTLNKTQLTTHVKSVHNKIKDYKCA